MPYAILINRVGTLIMDNINKLNKGLNLIKSLYYYSISNSGRIHNENNKRTTKKLFKVIGKIALIHSKILLLINLSFFGAIIVAME